MPRVAVICKNGSAARARWHAAITNPKSGGLYWCTRDGCKPQLCHAVVVEALSSPVAGNGSAGPRQRRLIGVLVMAMSCSVRVGTNSNSDGPFRTPADGSTIVALPSTLTDAIAAYRPHMADVARGMGQEIPTGTVELLTWMAIMKPSAPDISAIPETTFDRFLKDSSGERGKRICVSGSVAGINLVRGSYTYSTGSIVARRATVASFYTAADTGKIFRGSKARFCGVGTGVYEYESLAKKTIQSISLVGLFTAEGAAASTRRVFLCLPRNDIGTMYCYKTTGDTLAEAKKNLCAQRDSKGTMLCTPDTIARLFMADVGRVRASQADPNSRIYIAD
jgi:hypothetical protein